MTTQHTKVFSEEDVLPLLEENGIEEQVWHDLADAIKGGRVPLLVAETGNDGDKEVTRFLFAYGSFQRFLSKSLQSLTNDKGRTERSPTFFGMDAEEMKILNNLGDGPPTSPVGVASVSPDSSKDKGLSSPATVANIPPLTAGDGFYEGPVKGTMQSSLSPVLSKQPPVELTRVQSPRMPPLRSPRMPPLQLGRRSFDAGGMVTSLCVVCPPGQGSSWCAACGPEQGMVALGVVPVVQMQPPPELSLCRKSEVAGETLDLSSSFRDSPRAMPPLKSGDFRYTRQPFPQQRSV